MSIVIPLWWAPEGAVTCRDHLDLVWIWTSTYYAQTLDPPPTAVDSVRRKEMSKVCEGNKYVDPGFLSAPSLNGRGSRSPLVIAHEQAKDEWTAPNP